MQSRALDEASHQRRVDVESLQRELHAAELKAFAAHTLQAENERLRSELAAAARNPSSSSDATLRKEALQLQEQVRSLQLLFGFALLSFGALSKSLCAFTAECCTARTPPYP
jgi:hypothetical protein